MRYINTTYMVVSCSLQDLSEILHFNLHKENDVVAERKRYLLSPVQSDNSARLYVGLS